MEVMICRIYSSQFGGVAVLCTVETVWCAQSTTCTLAITDSYSLSRNAPPPPTTVDIHHGVLTPPPPQAERRQVVII